MSPDVKLSVLLRIVPTHEKSLWGKEPGEAEEFWKTEKYAQGTRFIIVSWKKSGPKHSSYPFDLVGYSYASRVADEIYVKFDIPLYLANRGLHISVMLPAVRLSFRAEPHVQIEYFDSTDTEEEIEISLQRRIPRTRSSNARKMRRKLAYRQGALAPKTQNSARRQSLLVAGRLKRCRPSRSLMNCPSPNSKKRMSVSV